MKFASYLAASLLAAYVQSSAALALSLTNRDDQDHKVTIIVEGASPRDHVLKPEGSLEVQCPKGCVIRLNDSEDDEYELEGNEIVVIEDGYLYYDGPDAPAEQPPGDSKGGDGKAGDPKKK